jgi:hypothetical protein
MAGAQTQETARRLHGDSTAAEFATLHVVGNTYEHRVPETTMPLPALRAARTLRDLAQVYDRPLSEFERLNQPTPPDLPLRNGEWVKVPDSGFAPLLAARLAAQVLTDSALPRPDRCRVIEMLALLTAANPTALDTLLSRLLLAWRACDLVTFAALKEIETDTVPESPEGIQLPALPS